VCLHEGERASKMHEQIKQPRSQTDLPRHELIIHEALDVSFEVIWRHVRPCKCRLCESDGKSHPGLRIPASSPPVNQLEIRMISLSETLILRSAVGRTNLTGRAVRVGSSLGGGMCANGSFLTTLRDSASDKLGAAADSSSTCRLTPRADCSAGLSIIIDVERMGSVKSIAASAHGKAAADLDGKSSPSTCRLTPRADCCAGPSVIRVTPRADCCAGLSVIRGVKGAGSVTSISASAHGEPEAAADSDGECSSSACRLIPQADCAAGLSIIVGVTRAGSVGLAPAASSSNRYRPDCSVSSFASGAILPTSRSSNWNHSLSHRQ
jgi:hypothetical protein